jgi:hypothetical protein
VPYQNLPFEGFLAYLRGEGFRVGVDSSVRLYQVIAGLTDDCSPTILKLRLCPLFAQSEQDQQRFSAAFESYFEIFFDRNWVPVPMNYNRQKRRHRNRYAIGAIATIAVVAVFAFYFLDRAPAVINGTPIREQAATSTGRIVYTLVSGEPSPWLPPAIGALAAAMLLLWRIRPQWLLKETSEPGYRRANQREFLVSERDLHVLSAGLRRPQQTSAGEMDVEATVRGTILRLGYPNVQYKRRAVTPEYLFLIDRTGPRDHLAKLLDQLGRSLANEQVYIDSYFFDGDPRVCVHGETGEFTQLETLRRRRPQHVLLLAGEPQRLQDPLTRRMPAWMLIAERWERRALLATNPPDTTVSRSFGEIFATFPVGAEGLRAAIEHFRYPERPFERCSGWLWTAKLPGKPRDEWRGALGADRFRWLCSCAVYPVLQWELTLHLGRSLIGEHAIRPDYMLALLAIPWFRDGAIPEQERLWLVRQIGGADRERVVRTIESFFETKTDDGDPRDPETTRRDTVFAAAGSAGWLDSLSPFRANVATVVRAFEVERRGSARSLPVATAAVTVALVAGTITYVIGKRLAEPHQQPVQQTAPASRADTSEVDPNGPIATVAANPDIPTLAALRERTRHAGVREYVLEGETGSFSTLPALLEATLHPPGAKPLSQKPFGLAPGQSLDLRFKEPVSGIGIYYQQSLYPGTFSFYDGGAAPKLIAGVGYPPATGFLGYSGEKPLERVILQPQATGFLYVIRIHIFSGLAQQPL